MLHSQSRSGPTPAVKGSLLPLAALHTDVRTGSTNKIAARYRVLRGCLLDEKFDRLAARSGQSRSPNGAGRRRICRRPLMGCCDHPRNRRYAEKVFIGMAVDPGRSSSTMARQQYLQKRKVSVRRPSASLRHTDVRARLACHASVFVLLYNRGANMGGRVYG
jgi:hypothetical protein